VPCGVEATAKLQVSSTAKIEIQTREIDRLFMSFDSENFEAASGIPASGLDRF